MNSERCVLFSIIIPTYNRADKIANAIDSVLQQTYPHYEILIVDDGSTDNTDEVVSNYDDKRLKYFKKKNEERSIARNFGVQHANGDYVNFLDSDDILYPNHLSLASKLFANNSFPEIGHLGYEYINEDHQTIRTVANLDDGVAEKLIHDNVLVCNGIFIRRDIAIQYPFIHDHRAVISEDWYLWLVLTSRFRLYVENTITSGVVEHDQRSLRDIHPDKLLASTKLVIDHLSRDEVFMNKYKRKTSYFFSNMYTLVTLVLALTSGRRQDVVRFLFVAIRIDWKVIFRRRFLASCKYLLFT